MFVLKWIEVLSKHLAVTGAGTGSDKTSADHEENVRSRWKFGQSARRPWRNCPKQVEVRTKCLQIMKKMSEAGVGSDKT